MPGASWAGAVRRSSEPCSGPFGGELLLLRWAAVFRTDVRQTRSKNVLNTCKIKLKQAVNDFLIYRLEFYASNRAVRKLPDCLVNHRGKKCVNLKKDSYLTLIYIDIRHFFAVFCLAVSFLGLKSASKAQILAFAAPKFAETGAFKDRRIALRRRYRASRHAGAERI